MIEVTYRKIQRTGEWGICGPAGMREGDRVRAVRKSGGSQIVTVGAIVWTGGGKVIAEMIRDSDARDSRRDSDPEARAAESEAPRPAPRASAPEARASDNGGPPPWDAPPPSDDDYLTAA
jgi:hypothetical protein